jgi:AcrR family transcriptional regulator
VSVDEIVKAARVNKRMVYHYYGDKAGLYAAVLTSVYSRLAEIESDVFRDQPSVSQALEGIVRAYFRFLQDTPEFVSLLLWENLQGGAHIKNLGAALSKAPILEALGEVIDKGIASRQIRSNIDRQHMLVHLFGLCQIYFSNRHTLKQSVGLDLEDSQTLEEGIKSVIALLKSGYITQ